MADGMLELIRFGLPMETVLNLDMLSFAGAQESMARILSKKNVDSAIKDRVVQHGDGNLFKKLISGWENEAVVPDSDTALQKTDLDQFVNKFRGGI